MKIEILMFDMILKFKFIYDKKKKRIVTIQTIHLIVLSPSYRFFHLWKVLSWLNKGC
jgi:hypothetical protein